ncbi:MAG: NPCBM/NEW2 domain-containing protein [Planctomycetaceae bacterium]|nr:NPCBM/NEW2 domain-containing protein [Planctomycetaceae bacterium]
MNVLLAIMARAELLLAATVIWIAAGAAIAQEPPAASGATLVLLDGESVAAKSLSLAAGKITGEGVPDGLTLDDLRRIELSSASPAIDKPAVVVELRGGGRILGKAATIGDDKCQVEWSLGERLSVPIDVVRAIRFGPEPAGEFDKSLAAPAADADRIFFKVDGKSDSVSGLIAGLTAEQLTFQMEGQERTLPRAQLVGIVVAQPQAADEATRVTVHLRDGSRLAGDLAAIAGERATMVLPGGGQVEFPWTAARSVHVRSTRVAFLSDLKPVEVDEATLVTLPRPWQRDKSVLGKPLTLGTRVFDKGIGVHARSALTFAAGRKYDVLAAVIGIDAAAAGKGDCVFQVLGDGQSLFTQRIKGNDPPQTVNLDISRFEQITLLVEPGEGLDLADHADWCDVRMIKSK